MNIVIVGAGIAGTLHLQCYLKAFGNSLPLLAVVDIRKPHPQFTEILSQHGLKPQQVSKLKDLARYLTDADSVLIDVCTPTDTHATIIGEAVDVGFRNILVEKPLVSRYSEFQRFRSPEINLAVVTNYLHSKLTQAIGEFITQRPSAPYLIAMNFSKNRVADTFQRRGFTGSCPPHVFTVEMPHQLYLLLSWIGRPHLRLAFTEDMAVDGHCFRHHGSGLIICELLPEQWPGQRITSLLRSNLAAPRTIRQVTMVWEDGTILWGEYPSNRAELVSKLTLKRSGNVRSHSFPNDDMLTRNLLYLYEKFAHGQSYEFLPLISMFEQQVQCLDEWFRSTSQLTPLDKTLSISRG